MNRLSATNGILLLIALILTGVAMRLAQPVIIALLIALLLGYMMDPLVLLLRRLSVPLWAAVPLTALLFLAIFFGFGILITSSLLDFARDFPYYQARFTALVRDLIAALPPSTQGVLRVQILEELRRIPVTAVALNAVGSTFSLLFGFLVMFLFSNLILYGKYRLIHKILRSVPRAQARRIVTILIHIDDGLRRYLGVKTLMSLLIGVSTGIVLVLFGVQFAIILGVLTFLLNFIPTLGSGVATVLPPLVALLQWAQLARPFWIFVILLGLQNLVGTLLEPRIVGERLNLSLPVVFFSLLFWGWLWGPAGVLLAVPMTTAIKIVLANIPALHAAARLLEPLPKRRSPAARRPADLGNPDPPPFSV